MIRRHFVGGIILVLVGVYFLLGGLSWLPENSQAMVWPLALIIAGVLFLFKSGHRGPWNDKQRMFRDHREWMKHGHYGHAGMNFANNQQQSESEDGFLRSDNTFGAARHVVLDELFKGAVVLLVEEQRLTCAILISHREKHTSIWIAAGEASKYMSLLTGK